MASPVRIRQADPAADAAACAALYAPSITDSVTSFEVTVPSDSEFEGRIRGALKAHAWLVAEDRDGTVVGYAYGGTFRSRAAYRHTAEVSVYIARDASGRGLGSLLYTSLFETLAERGYHMAVAGITLPNDASLRLHRSVGFTDVGTFVEVGWKFDTWRDVHWMQRRL